MLNDHPWEKSEKLPVYMLIVHSRWSWTNYPMSLTNVQIYMSRYMLNDHSWEKSDKLLGTYSLSTPGEVGQIAQWVSLMRHHSQKKSTSLPEYLYNEHSLESLTTCPDTHSVTTLGRSWTACLAWAQWVSMMRHHSWRSWTNSPISLPNETLLSQEVH